MQRFHNLSLLGQIVLYELYVEATHAGDFLAPEEISRRISTEVVNKRMIGFVLDELQGQGNIEGGSVAGWAISSTGFRYVQRRMAMTGSAIERYSADSEWLFNEAKDGDDAPLADGGGRDIPAADRVVTRADNADAFDEAAKSLDEVLEEFRDDRKLGNILGEEKPILVKTLEAGRNLLGCATINVQMGYLLTVEPLRNFVIRHKDQIITGSIIALINKTIEKLVEALLGGE